MINITNAQRKKKRKERQKCLIEQPQKSPKSVFCRIPFDKDGKNRKNTDRR